MIKAKPWNGKDLKGEWEITLKIDGVRMLRDEDGKPVSRSGKPLYNLDHVPPEITDAEIFCKDWETSVSMVRTHDAEPVPLECVYSLSPLDERLYSDTWNPSNGIPAPFIQGYLQSMVEDGYEGLVLRQGDKWLKVKPKETYDVLVTGQVEGTGKYKGKLGAFETVMGKVGTGFTDEQREEFWNIRRPTIIEVECMSLTKNGKFRHPRFVRVRWDK